MSHENWWEKPRIVSVLVDNDGWGRPWGQRLVERLRANGEDARFFDSQEDLAGGGVAIFMNCVRLTRPDVLARNHRNLVVHASDLPKGRGRSPWTWMILEGASSIPVSMIDAAEGADEGNLIYKDWLDFEGHELVDEVRDRIAWKTIELFERFLAQPTPPSGAPQQGESSWYPRRRPADSRLDTDKTIAEQFNLLRVVDNQRYPAFFDYRGKRYVLRIEKVDEGEVGA